MRLQKNPAKLFQLIFCFFLCAIICQGTASADQTPLSLDDAKHLLFRTGLGASAGELNKFIGRPRDESVEQIINGLRTNTQLPMPSWTMQPSPHHWTYSRLSKTDRRNFNEARDRELSSLKIWWVRQMIETEYPQTERLVLMWHNHFATAYSGINSQAIAIARQHQLFREHGTGYFGDLLKHLIRDPALLNYLDNDKSRKQSPNENLARELLELFALGEGNYSESDVKSAARALTGYSVDPLYNMQFRFRQAFHDDGMKTIFGQSGRFDGDDLVDLILQQPQTATFIAKRFWRTYISDLPPEASELQQLADTFRHSGYSLKALYRATLMSDAFWHHKHRASMVRSPVSLVLGTIRSTGMVPQHWQTLPSTLANMGQNLFDPPNVAGWSGGSHWITPSRLLYRLNWLEQMAQSCASPDCANKQTLPDGSVAPITPDSMTANSMTANFMATSTMSGDVDSSQIATTVTATNPGNASPHSLRIRLASEDFDGAAQYRLSIHRADEVLWTTGPISVAGGHDSNRLGRMKLDQNIPWQVVEFMVDADTPDFDEIKIAFLNDAAKNGADRNLYIDHVVYNGEHFSAASGTQDSSCPPKQPHQAGRLYCNGTLTLARTLERNRTLERDRIPEKALATNSANTNTMLQPPQKPLQLKNTSRTDSQKKFSATNQFTAGGIYLRTAQSPKSRHNPLGIVLTDVQLNGRHWHMIHAKFFSLKQKTLNKAGKVKSVKPNDNRYVLRLDNYSCWPGCVQEWPQCASIAKNRAAVRRLNFPLVSKIGTNVCQYQSLTELDRMLVNTLWYNIDRMYQLSRDSIPPKRQQLLADFVHWSAHVDNMSTQYKQSPYQSNTGEELPRLQLATAASTAPVVADNFMRSTPSPVGQISTQREIDWTKLTSTTPHVSLQSVLLPADPLADIDGSMLQDVLTDLSAQLQ